MRVYHVDRYYDHDGRKYYSTLPYSLEGTMKMFWGLEFKPLRWKMSWHPWYYRVTGSIKWLLMTRRTEERAKRLADKLNSKC